MKHQWCKPSQTGWISAAVWGVRCRAVVNVKEKKRRRLLRKASVRLITSHVMDPFHAGRRVTRRQPVNWSNYYCRSLTARERWWNLKGRCVACVYLTVQCVDIAKVSINLPSRLPQNTVDWVHKDIWLHMLHWRLKYSVLGFYCRMVNIQASIKTYD